MPELPVLASDPAPHVRLIRLNRPAARNALSIELLRLLRQELERAEADETRVVILAGDESAFSAGADIKEMPENGIPMWGQADRLRAWKKIERFRKPLIAAIEGFALGGGCELVLLCDIAIAGRDARFGFPEVRIAAFPGDGGTQRAPRAIGRSRAALLMMTGDFIGAEKAERWGLVTECVEAGASEARALEIATRIAEMSPIAVEMIKEEIAMVDQKSLDESLSLERKLLLWQTQDHDEGIAAFVEKRKPDFKGR